MMATVYDAVVVGAGIEGSSAAYYLAKHGHRTLLLEQFPLPHSRGSSHGQSRITRRAYPQSYYTRMMKDAYDLWDKLEQESGMAIYKKTGMLTIGKYDGPCLTEVETSMRTNGAALTKLSPQKFQREYPMLRYADDYGAIMDPDGGLLRADKALAAYHMMFQRFEGVLKDGEPVTDILPGDIITIKTTKGVYKTRNVVLALGPWASKLLRPLGLNLPLEPQRISVCYWRENKSGAHSSDTFPCFLEESGSGTFDVYSVPADEYPGYVKVCLHTGPKIDPDSRDDVDSDWTLKKITRYVTEHCPWLESSPAIVETCIYTNTPDHDFILDTHPTWKNIVVAAGFSGHGFKLAPAVGKALFEIVVRKTPSYDMRPFRMDRFRSTARL